MGGQGDTEYSVKSINERLSSLTAKVDEQWSPIPYVLLAFAAGLIAAIGILGWQIYFFLRVGHWPALSIIAALSWADVEWAKSPDDWRGVHELLDNIPLSLSLFFVGLAPMAVWAYWDGREEKAREDRAQ